MFGAKIEAGVISKVGKVFLFFIVNKTAVESYAVSFCSGEGEKIRPTEPAGTRLCEQTDCFEDVVFSFVRETNNDKNGAVHAGVINKPYGLNNGLISHMTVENGFADFFAAGLDTKFYDFAVRGFEVRCKRAVEKAEMRIDDKGEFTGLPVEARKFIYIGFIKGKNVVIENEGGDTTVMIKEKFYLVNYAADTEPADVVEVFEGAFKVVFVSGDHFMVETVGTGEWASP